MLMKAGKLFYHQEAVMVVNQGVKFFIRPRQKDSQSAVIFEELEELQSENK